MSQFVNLPTFKHPHYVNTNHIIGVFVQPKTNQFGACISVLIVHDVFKNIHHLYPSFPKNIFKMGITTLEGDDLKVYNAWTNQRLLGERGWIIKEDFEDPINAFINFDGLIAERICNALNIKY